MKRRRKDLSVGLVTYLEKEQREAMLLSLFYIFTAFGLLMFLGAGITLVLAVLSKFLGT